ncbi:MAG TPA: hypothetical protein VF168_01785 [Trueperaceae bacterium]
MALTFQELRQELFRLYEGRRYAEATELLRSGLEDHPTELPRITFWLACLECRAGRPSAALVTLSAYLSSGGWMSPLHLRNDDDLEPLRGDPAFERIVAECETRLEAEKGRIQPKLLLELPAASSDAVPPLLMALHMMGGTAEESLYRWRPAVDKGMMLAAPQGSELVGPDAYAWNERAAAELRTHLGFIEREVHYDPGRLILAGASQGARMAVQFACQRAVPSTAFIALVGAPAPERIEPHLEAALGAGLRGVFITGELDPARKGIEATYSLLQQAGVPVQLEVVPGLGHDYPANLAALLGEALTFLHGH